LAGTRSSGKHRGDWSGGPNDRPGAEIRRGCRLTKPPATTDKGTMKDYYGLLGLAPDATTEIIKTAYRKKAAQFHPDRNPEPDAAAKFRAVQEAYEVLADSERRKVYDDTRRTSLIDDPLVVAREIWSSYMGNIQK